jgi:hypothetical protein
MATITFDTHQFIRTLEDSGIPVKQAEAITAAFKAAQAETQPATKQDTELIRNEMATKIALAETRADLTRWIIGAGFLQTALIAGLLLKLVK